MIRDQLFFKDLSRTYWIGLYYAGNPTGFNDLKVNSTGDILLAGRRQVGSLSDGLYAKINSSGDLIGSRLFYRSAETDKLECIGSDSSNNIYVLGDQTISSIWYGTVAKYNSAGVLQWQKIHTDQYSGYTNCVVTSSGVIYATGYSRAGAANGQKHTVCKIDSDGNLAWARTLNVSSSSTEAGRGIAIDGSENVYVCGITQNTDIIIAKYDSSGTLQWQRSLVGTSIDNSWGLALDSSSNVYIIGSTRVSTINHGLIVKYDSSGTLQWQKTLNSTVAISFGSIVIDTNDNIYVTGNESNAGGLVIKYNTTGDVQWIRSLSTELSSLTGVGVDANGDIICCVPISSNGGYILKLPASGSVTGTFNVKGPTGTRTVTISNVSYTQGTGTLTDSAGSFIEGTTGVVITDGTLLDTTLNWTEGKNYI